MSRHLGRLAATTALFAAIASAQLQSNASLKGVYNVRYLGVQTGNQTTSKRVAAAFSGTITFDGNGNYTVDGQGVTGEGTLRFQPTGTYKVLSSGMLYMQDPFDAVRTNGTSLFGSIGANGAVIASATDSPEDTFEDLMVAVPAATTASPSTLNGTYRVAHLEFLAGDTVGGTRNSFFSITSNGAGSLGDVSVRGTAQALRGTATTQTSVGATYTMTANGTGTIVFPVPSGVTAANTLISGTKALYVAADGSFFVAGSANGYDMEIGVRASATPLNGLYWTAFLQNYDSGDDFAGIYSAVGSASEEPSARNREIAHSRTCWSESVYCWDAITGDQYTIDSNGIATSDFGGYAIGANGTMAVSTGSGSTYQLVVYVKAPAMTAPSGTTVFLNPQGIVNAASFAPITSAVAPGAMISLFGTGIGPANAVQGSAPLGTTLGGVQVRVNGAAVPVVAVSATQVSAIVPYTAPSTGELLTIEVVNNGVTSNPVSVYSGITSPGAFLYPTNATTAPFAVAAVKYPEGTVVTEANPARLAGVVSLYLSGLGEVRPPVAAGELTPANTTSTVTDQYFSVYIDGIKANVSYAGLAGFGGFYQVNLTIPQGVTPDAKVPVYIETIDAISYQGTMPIAR